MVEGLKYKFGFEKLKVWQNSIEFVKLVYGLTKKFPQSELYCLSSQIKRAVVSIPSNIAEGSTRKSLKDQARFSEIAFGSLIETLNQLIIAKELDYIDSAELDMCRNEIDSLSRQINAFKNSQLERHDAK